MDDRLHLRGPEFDHYNVDTTPTFHRIRSVGYNKNFMSANLKYAQMIHFENDSLDKKNVRQRKN